MNLFILSLNTQKCAEYMFDKHISKIIIEAVQMLCTAIQLIDPDNPIKQRVLLYKISHKNHPVTIWIRTSLENYLWTLKLVKSMHKEWRYRYGHMKTHKSYIIARYLKKYAPTADKFSTIGRTPFALAMPDKYKTSNPVLSYRLYYQGEEKQHLATWKNRDKPKWYK